MENCELHCIFDRVECVEKNTGLLSLFSIHENKFSLYILTEAAGSRKGSKEEAIKTASEKFQ